MTTKRQTWDSLPRASKLAACLWPQLVPEHIKQEMNAISRGENRTSPLDALRADNARSGTRGHLEQCRFRRVIGYQCR
jgi:hypothetical protein